jgi:hypothetical protein
MMLRILRTGFRVSVLVGSFGLAACSSSSSDGATSSSSLPLCTSSGKAAFATYGANAFVAVNESIFTNVTNELQKNSTTNLGTAFTKIGTGNPPSTADDLATFKGNLAAFLVYAYGGPSSITYTDGKTYSGPQDMKESHAGLAITSDQYDYFVSSIIVPALTSNGVPMADVTSCFAPVVTDATFKASIVGQ